MIELPDASVRVVQVLKNNGDLSLAHATHTATLVVIPLASPLAEGDRVVARLVANNSDQWVPDRNGLAVKSGGRSSGRCPSVEGDQGDGRPVFEPSAFVGASFDSFTAAELTSMGYSDPQEGAGKTGRLLAGVQAEYRVWGTRSSKVQLWASGNATYGVKTAEVKVRCDEDPDEPLCQPFGPDSGHVFYQILDRASTLQTYLGLRLEFLTLQQESTTPIRLYATCRFGFVDLVQKPGDQPRRDERDKVFESDLLGVGFLVPSGPFRGTRLQWAWGRTSLFQSNPGWNRLKINGRLASDLVPSLAQKAQFWKYLGAGSWRVFLEVQVDRNPTVSWLGSEGRGPDSVETHFGFVFDFSRIFVPLIEK